MGFPIARNLLNAGHELVIFTRTTAKAEALLAGGAESATDPADVARRADIVFTMLPDSTDVTDVLTGDVGLMAGSRPGMTWIDMSTISPEVTRSLVARFNEQGVACLDAPVSGGPAGARDGTLSIMVGGPEPVFERCLPLLRLLGQKIVHVGDTGSGQVTKACNQVVIAATLCGIAEALVLGGKAGVDPGLIREALMGGYAGSRLLEVHGERMINHAFAPGFFVRLHGKDLRIALEIARELSVSLPITALVEQLFNALVAHGDGELDNSSVVKIFEELALSDLGVPDVK